MRLPFGILGLLATVILNPKMKRIHLEKICRRLLEIYFLVEYLNKIRKGEKSKPTRKNINIKVNTNNSLIILIFYPWKNYLYYISKYTSRLNVF